MADSTTIDFTTNQGGQGLAAQNVVVKYEQYIDCTAATGANLAAASYALWDVPEGHVHLTTVLEVITPEGGASTIDVGVTGGTVDVLLDGGDVNGAAGLIFTDVDADYNSTGTSAGYVTPDGGQTFSLLCNDALDTAVFRLTSVWLDLRSGSTFMGDTA